MKEPDNIGKASRNEHGLWSQWRLFTHQFGASKAQLKQRLARQEAQLQLLHGKVLDLEGAVRSLSATLQRTRIVESALSSTLATKKIFLTPPPEVIPVVIELLWCLKPLGVTGYPKVRIGRDHDSGYVMVDDFKSVGTALSIGIGADASWDTSMVERGIRVLQFDHTIETSPSTHERCTFYCKRIVPSLATNPQEITISEVINNYIVPNEFNQVLKVDIEGDEWDVFDQLEASVLDRFRQIVCEFHDFHRVVDVEWRNRALRVFKKLNSYHAVVHIHGNNFRPMVSIADVLIPDVMEFTLVRRRSYEITNSEMSFPTPLDNANDPNRLDYYLGGFDF